jgi:TonB-linked SusC/RagA family outer membrane protein
MKRILFILFCLPLMANITFAQITVTGTVTSATDNDPIPGANVVIRGTTIGTITNVEGNYTLSNVPSEATLVFSFIGMQTQEIYVDGRSEINVSLGVDAIGIEEVVSIGYGTARAIDLTAPIKTITSEDITRTISTNAISALQGSVPGVQVINQGAPGSSPQLRIRGIGSMQGSQPLYVVDGMFYSNINWLSPNDINSISVLKDASAASIYGVRAAGGVVMITTKQGRHHEGIVIEYAGYTGINSTSNLMKMTNTEQYSTMLIEAGIASRLEPSVELWGGRPFTHNGTQYTIPATETDWYNELLGPEGGTGRTMNHSLSLRGGTETTTYHVGTSYTSEDGLFRLGDHKWERINMRANINFNPYNFLEIGTSLNINHNRTQNPGSVWGSIYYAVPTMPVRNSDDDEDFAGPVAAGYSVGPVNNPFAQLYYQTGNFNFSRGLNLDYNAFANIRFLGDDRLVYRTQFSHRIGNGHGRSFSPVYFIDDKLKNEVSTLNKNHNNSSLIHLDHTLTFRNTFGGHGITTMAGFSTRHFNSRNLSGSANNVPGDYEHYLYFFNSTTSGPEYFSVGDGGSTEVGASFFGRLMYNYEHKYLLNATFRGDGTDKYSQTWGYFPSFGVGWVVSQEPFMQAQGILDFLKLRASWGQLGNNNVARESGSRAISTGFNLSYIFNDVIMPGYRPSIFYNTLIWEVLEETNAGIEFSTLNHRLSAEIDWYRKVTKNAAHWTNNLMGAGGLIRNQGEILNTGYEFTLSWRDQVGDFGYNVSSNVSTLRNEVLDLGGQPYITSGSDIRTQVGHPLYSFYGYRVEGIYQTQEEIEAHINTEAHPQVEPGFLRFEDVNGDGIIDHEDRQFLGANIPTLTYGGQINLNYRNFDFNASVYGVHGNKIINSLRGQRSHHGDYNFDMDLYENRWTGEGTSNTHPSAFGTLHSWNMNNLSTFLVESGSFFRIQNITIGYTFENLIPGSATGSKLRLRLSAQNPYTRFAFNGFTPEVTGTGQAAGVHPIPTSYTIGVNITY